MWGNYFTEWDAKRSGRRDAQFNFPAPGEPPAGKLGRYESAVERHLIDEEEALNRKHGRKHKKIQTGVEREALERKKLEEAEAAWKDRGRKPDIPYWMHYFFLFLLLIGDIAINEIAFRPLEAHPVLTLLMTLLVCTIIVVLAHFTGRKLKQPTRTGIENGLVALAIISAIGVSLAVGVARARYVDKKATTPITVASRSVATFSEPRPEPANDGSKTVWIFVLVQLAAFVAGTITAYASADPLEEQRRKHARAVDRRDHALTDHKKLWERFRARANRWASTGRQLEAAYLGENVKRRSDGVTQSQIVHIDPMVPEVFLAYKEPLSDSVAQVSVPVHLNGKPKHSTRHNSQRANQGKEDRR